MLMNRSGGGMGEKPAVQTVSCVLKHQVTCFFARSYLPGFMQIIIPIYLKINMFL
ncbi:hypothetical protein EXN66_Car002402 [Channa argus]|uniref:Uncharacterized protein n=1 Tax=Channa argus TaxID=215402 RepID=A0A6G1P8V0_CHAAH|nr:hypothetical protein EXN66_Car002402 [Channa argus]